MKQKVGIIGLLAFFVVIMVSVFAQAQSANPQETLNQYISDLQKNPNDNSLREKIIKHVQTMKPQPVVPQEAKRPFMKGVTFQKEATSVSDYELAISAYKEALLLAPWWPEALYNMALAQEGAGKFDDAIQSIKLYLLTGPKDAEQAENRMYVMEAKKEKAAISKVQEAAEKKKREEEFVRNLSGTWSKELLAPGGSLMWEDFYELVLKGQNSFELRHKYRKTAPDLPSVDPPFEDYLELTIQEGKVSGRNYYKGLPDSWCKKNTGYFIPIRSGTIAADGRSMVLVNGAHKSIMPNCTWNDVPDGMDKSEFKKR